MPPKICVEVAPPRAQAKCRVCTKRIDPGNVRIGVPVYRPGGMGIDLHHPASSSFHWHHAVCSLIVEQAPDARCSCKHCGGRIEKNTIRIGVRGPSMKSTAWNHLTCISDMLDRDQLRRAGIDVAKQFNPWWIMGYGTLTASQKSAVAAAIGCGLKLDDHESQRQHDDRLNVMKTALAKEKEQAQRSAKRKRNGAAQAKAKVKTCRFG